MDTCFPWFFEPVEGFFCHFGFTQDNNLTNCKHHNMVQTKTFVIRQTVEKSMNKNTDIHMCFLDLHKAFDGIQKKRRIKKPKEKRNTTEYRRAKAGMCSEPYRLLGRCYNKEEQRKI